MHVFVTGGTGLVGTAVVAELLAHDHTVLALARSEASAHSLATAGAETIRGGLGDLDVLREGARSTDGVINLAFGHDFSSAEAIQRSVAEEAAALGTIGAELVGTDKPFATTSGTPPIAGRISTESDALAMEGPLGGRGDSVQALLELAARGVRSMAIRLPRTVHDEGKGGFTGLLTEMARQSGTVSYPGDGTQRWPAVHARDAAVLFRLALEQAPAGTVWHAVADEGDAVRDLAEVIGRRLGLAVESVTVQEFGPLGSVFATDQPSSSAHTRATFDWTPTHPSLLDDLELIEA